MATTAKTIVPDTKTKGQKRKPMSKAHKAKLAASLADWRASLTDEDKAELRARTAAAHKARWDSMSERERRDRLAGVKAWHAQQRAAKKAEAKAAPKVGPKAKAAKPATATEVSESPAPARARKAVAK
jgi:hypothetical protein